MKNELYLVGKVKRLDAYDNYWRLWLTVPKIGIDGTTSVPVVGYSDLDAPVKVNDTVEIVGHLGWRRKGDDGFELVVVADSIKAVRQRDNRNGNGNWSGNGRGQRQAQRARDDDDIPY